MRLFQRTLVRGLSYYKVVTGRKEYKTVEKLGGELAPVIKLVDAKVKAGGPITVADYMKLVLTNPLTGYYMRRDVFGSKGDFITSPEVSQMFGEIVGIWIYYELRKIGIPKPWQLIELGPGRGTLMKDVLRVLKRLKALDNLSIHLVEISPCLASIQAQVLCEDVVSVGMHREEQPGPYYRNSKTTEDCPIFWYKSIDKIPRCFSVVIAHEFFDALPIRKYQRIDKGWREVLINSSTDDKGEIKLEYTLSKDETHISKLLIREDEKREHLEISPDAGAISKHIAELLEEEGGFALFMDYGHDGTKTDTFRAFKNHRVQDPLVDPGSADLTADVDFAFLREVMKDKLLVLGPVEQRDFLLRMGIKTRLDMLLERVSEESAREQLKSGYKMIVDKEQMGERFKCMSAFPLVLKDHLERYPVAGFFGEVKD